MESRIVTFSKQSALTRLEEAQIKRQLGTGTIIFQLVDTSL